ncbi:uncharacterized protein LOC141676685 [Apium graveolens]|uniref:uncharacterized protein LOC141676685 n=1 Tax=Apium graveolens TaxID=4045 RepID=UPI003D791414
MSWSRRNEVVKSSSFGDVGVRRMDSSVSILKKKRPGVAVEGRSIRHVVEGVGKIKNLECKLLEDDGEGDLEGSVDCGFGGFLENCSFCKKRIRRNMDVFMYGYLKAFCSPECRDVQIEMDERLRPPSPEPSLLSAIAKMVGASNAAKVTS